MVLLAIAGRPTHSFPCTKSIGIESKENKIEIKLDEFRMFSMVQKEHIFLDGKNTVDFALIVGKRGMEGGAVGEKRIGEGTKKEERD